MAVWCGGRATIGGDPDGGSLLACDVCGDVATGTVEQYKLTIRLLSVTYAK